MAGWFRYLIEEQVLSCECGNWTNKLETNVVISEFQEFVSQLDKQATRLNVFLLYLTV